MSFEQLISGASGPWWACVARAALAVAEVPYRRAVTWRNHRFDAGWATVHNVGVPVVSVGNITAGGTGKTPMVAWLGRWFLRHGVRVAFVSRGYKSRDEMSNDEARELHWALPEIPHIQNPDRVAAALQAIAQFDAQVIVLDDAFQHRRIHRDLDIVLIDALRPFGYRHVLPRGLLREPLQGLRRADVVGLSRVDAVDAHTRQSLHDEIMTLSPECAWLELAHLPRRLINTTGDKTSLAQLAGQRVVAFCGIGNPDGFHATIRELGCQIEHLHVFPDHHDYCQADLDQLRDVVAKAHRPIDALLCTHKDLVKLETAAIAGVPLWAVNIDIELRTGEDQLERRLEQLMEFITH